MRQSFDKSVPLTEQLLRVAGAKQKGRKHNHAPSAKVVQARKAGKKVWANTEAKRAKIYKKKVGAYWRGKLDTYP